MKQPPTHDRAGTKRFDQLPQLSPETLEVLHTLGFTSCTPVQDAVIPLFCGNKVRHTHTTATHNHHPLQDVAVDAATGSGKTLAFLLPVIERLRRLDDPLRKHQVGAMVIAPTRELAGQIHDVAQPLVASVSGLSSRLLVGGRYVLFCG